MSDLMQSILNFFEQDGWPVRLVEELNIAQTQFQGENGQWVCFAQARDSINQVIFYSICPVTTPENKFGQLAELITRINFDLPVGNFEMNYQDGQIRFKTSIDVEGENLTFNLVKNLVYANVYLMDEYLPGILKAIYSDESPANIVAKIESDDTSPIFQNN